jgi:hypothetical protein
MVQGIDFLTMDYEEFDKYMEEKYPELFKEFYGGFAIGPGWRHIVDSLCANIDWYCKHKELTVTVQQVKEKFGELRFYLTNGGDPAIGGMISMAESWAENTCEVCGERGKLDIKNHWMKTLCDTHIKERHGNTL